MKTQWQQLCAGLQARHRRNREGLCMACTDAHGRPVPHPCPRALMATPVVEARHEDVAVFRAFLPERVPGSTRKDRAPV